MSSQWSSGSGWADGNKAAAPRTGGAAGTSTHHHQHHLQQPHTHALDDAVSPSIASSTSASASGSSSHGGGGASTGSSVPSTPMSPASSSGASSNAANNGATAAAASSVPQVLHSTRGQTGALPPSHKAQQQQQQQDDEEEEDDEDEGGGGAAAGRSAGGASDSKMKRGHGASCHQCKTTKDPQYLFFCTNKAEKGVRKRRCRKKYCDSCLKRSYGHDLADIVPSWQCPSCLGMCICAACHRKSSKRGGAPAAAGGVSVDAAPDEEAAVGETAATSALSPAASPGRGGRASKAKSSEASGAEKAKGTPRSTKRNLAAASASQARSSSSSRGGAAARGEQPSGSSHAHQPHHDQQQHQDVLDQDEDESDEEDEEEEEDEHEAHQHQQHHHHHEHQLHQQHQQQQQHSSRNLPAPLLHMDSGNNAGAGQHGGIHHSNGPFSVGMLSSPNPLNLMGGAALMTPGGPMGMLGMGGMGMGMGMGGSSLMTPNGTNYNLQQLSTYPSLDASAAIDLDATATPGATHQLQQQHQQHPPHQSHQSQQQQPHQYGQQPLHQGLSFQQPRRSPSFNVDADDESGVMHSSAGRFSGGGGGGDEETEYGAPSSTYQPSSRGFQQHPQLPVDLSASQSQAELLRQAALSERHHGSMSTPSKTRTISSGSAASGAAGRLSISPLTISRDQSGDGVRSAGGAAGGTGSAKQSPRFSSRTLAGKGNSTNLNSSADLMEQVDAPQLSASQRADLEHLMEGMNASQRQSFLAEAAALAQQSAGANSAGSKTPLGQSPRSAKRKLAAVGSAGGRDGNSASGVSGGGGDISSPNQHLRLQMMTRLKSQLSGSSGGAGSESSSGVPSPTVSSLAAQVGSLSAATGAAGTSDEEVIARTKLLQNQQQQLRLQHAIKFEQARAAQQQQQQFDEERRRESPQQRYSPSHAYRGELNIKVEGSGGPPSSSAAHGIVPTPSPPFASGLPPSHTPNSSASSTSSSTSSSTAAATAARRPNNLPSPLTHLTASPNSHSSGSGGSSTPASMASSGVATNTAALSVSGQPSQGQMTPAHQLLPSLFSPLPGGQHHQLPHHHPHPHHPHLPSAGLASPSMMLNLSNDAAGGGATSGGPGAAGSALFSPPAPMFPTSTHLMLPGQQSHAQAHMQWGGGGSGPAAHQQTPSVVGGGNSLLSPLPGSLLMNFPVTPALPHSNATGGAGISGSHHASSAFHSDLGMGMLSPFGSSNVSAGGGGSLPPHHTYPVVPAAAGASTAAVSSSSPVLPAAPQSGSLEYRQLSASGQNTLMDGGAVGGALGLRGESATGFGLGLGLGLRGESSSAFEKDPFGVVGIAGSSSNSTQAAHDFLRQTSANANMQPFQ